MPGDARFSSPSNPEHECKETGRKKKRESNLLPHIMIHGGLSLFSSSLKFCCFFQNDTSIK